jgi:two-component system, OmpR family, response regulator
MAVAMPPATVEDIGRVAPVRLRREAIRALVVNDVADAGRRLAALSLGFDDAVPASAGPEEIAGRMLQLAGRTRGDARDRLHVGRGVELDVTARSLRRDGRLVQLRPMEFRLLEVFAHHPGRPISRRWLLRRMTVRGVGYQLVLGVETDGDQHTVNGPGTGR